MGNVIFFLVLAGLILGFRKIFGCYAPQRRLRVMAASYFGILLVSLVIFLMIPNRDFVEIDNVDQKAIEIAEQAAGRLLPAATKGRLDQMDGAYVTKQWRFEFNEKTLKVFTSDEGFSTMIVAERTKNNDGIIEMTAYATRSIVAGIDFTDKLNVPQVELTGNELKITNPDRYEVVLFRYGDSTIAQFTGEGEIPNKRGFQGAMGMQVLYLSIPEGVAIEDTALGRNIRIEEKAL